MRSVRIKKEIKSSTITFDGENLVWKKAKDIKKKEKKNWVIVTCGSSIIVPEKY